MSLSFQGTKPRYKTVNGQQYRIIRKKGFFGVEERLERLVPKTLFPKGWAIIKNESCRKGIFHYFEQNKYHSLCRISTINDNPKKRLYVNLDTYQSQKYRPCKRCIAYLRFWKVTGIHPDKRDTENVKH